jgi:hypothetical protein
MSLEGKERKDTGHYVPGRHRSILYNKPNDLQQLMR